MKNEVFVPTSFNDLANTIHEQAVANLLPYVEIASFDGNASDPASAFFDFIVEVAKQISGYYSDSDVLECLADAFVEMDNDLSGGAYHLSAIVTDVNRTPQLTVELRYARNNPCDADDPSNSIDDSLMTLVVDMPSVKAVISKRARY